MTEKAEKPVAWLHTMWLEFGQSQVRVSTSSRHPWGHPGVDYSECYPITSEPLMRVLPKVRRPKVVVR